MTRAGDLYFFRRSSEDPSQCNLYFAAGEGGNWVVSTRLPEPLNSGSLDYDPFAAPDGSYLIFCSRRPGGFGQGDVYISFSTAQGWGTPINLGPRINSCAEESQPSVTLDGTHFFFTSSGTS